jgi:hypothetical protein
MPNRAAKSAKQKRRKINLLLRKTGRTSAQVKKRRAKNARLEKAFPR